MACKLQTLAHFCQMILLLFSPFENSVCYTFRPGNILKEISSQKRSPGGCISSISFPFSLQSMVDCQNGLLGQAAARCVSRVYKHEEGSVTIHLRDVVGIPVALWTPNKRSNA